MGFVLALSLAKGLHRGVFDEMILFDIVSG